MTVEPSWRLLIALVLLIALAVGASTWGRFGQGKATVFAALRAIVQQIQQLESTSVSIAAAVDQQSVAGQDLARSIDLAARSTEEVSANIAQVRETSLATGSAASQVLSYSTQLEHQAASLKQMIEQFRSQADGLLKDAQDRAAA